MFINLRLGSTENTLFNTFISEFKLLTEKSEGLLAFSNFIFFIAQLLFTYIFKICPDEIFKVVTGETCLPIDRSESQKKPFGISLSELPIPIPVPVLASADSTS